MEMGIDNMELRKAIKEMTGAIRAKRKSSKQERKPCETRSDAHQDWMEANMNSWREQTIAYQETAKARLECKEPTTEDMESED
jgi:hypothetical protein